MLKRIGLVARGSDVKPFPPASSWLNRAFTAALHVEARLLRQRRMRLRAGLSAICVAQKPLR